MSKSGSGTLVFSGANTYAGATTVSAGTLLVSSTGSINNSSTSSVEAGATLVYNSSMLFQSAATEPQPEGEFPHEPMFSGARFACNHAFDVFSNHRYRDALRNISRNSRTTASTQENLGADGALPSN